MRDDFPGSEMHVQINRARKTVRRLTINGRERVLNFPSPSQVSIEKPLFSFPASQFVRVFRRKSLCANPVFFRSSTGQFPKVVRSEK